MALIMISDCLPSSKSAPTARVVSNPPSVSLRMSIVFRPTRSRTPRPPSTIPANNFSPPPTEEVDVGGATAEESTERSLTASSTGEGEEEKAEEREENEAGNEAGRFVVRFVGAKLPRAEEKPAAALKDEAEAEAKKPEVSAESEEVEEGEEGAAQTGDEVDEAASVAAAEEEDVASVGQRVSTGGSRPEARGGMSTAGCDFITASGSWRRGWVIRGGG